MMLAGDVRCDGLWRLQFWQRLTVCVKGCGCLLLVRWVAGSWSANGEHRAWGFRGGGDGLMHDEDA